MSVAKIWCGDCARRAARRRLRRSVRAFLSFSWSLIRGSTLSAPHAAPARSQIRPLWRHHFLDKQGLIFVVDSTDRNRIGEARDELHRTLYEDELRDAVLLVFANKQDLPNAMNAAEITDKLGLHALRNRFWNIQSTSATSGEGLQAGLEWLCSKLEKVGTGSVAIPIKRTTEADAARRKEAETAAAAKRTAEAEVARRKEAETAAAAKCTAEAEAARRKEAEAARKAAEARVAALERERAAEAEKAARASASVPV
jgi:hypothetical protein